MELRTAIERWYDDCIGGHEPVRGDNPLAYEPRAAWACARCSRILVGVKSGELYSVDQRSVKRLPAGWVREGVQSLFGCINVSCPTFPALVGDGTGVVHVVMSPEEARPIRVGDGKVILVHRVTPPNQDKLKWGVAVTDQKDLTLFPIEPPTGVAKSEKLYRNVWWIRREGNLAFPTLYSEERWLLVSTEGHVSRAQFEWEEKGPTIRVAKIGRLREMPLWVAMDRNRDRARSLVYGTQDGLRGALLDRKGLRRERALFRGGRIHFARVQDVFEVPHMIICGSEGRIWSRPWEHPEDTESPRWFAWRPLPADALFVDVQASAKDDDEVHARVILRNHRVYEVPLYNKFRVRRSLHDASEVCWRQALRMEVLPTFERATDAACLAAISADDRGPHVDRIVRLAARGGELTLQGILKRMRRFPGPDYQGAVRIGVAVLRRAVLLGHEGVQKLARELCETCLLLLKNDPHEDLPPDRKSELATRRRVLEDWVVFLKKHFVGARSFSEKREGLSALVLANRERKTPDSLIYATRIAAQGFDVEWESEPESKLSSPVLAFARRSDPGGSFIGMTLGDGSLLELSSRTSRPEPPPLRGAGEGSGAFRDYSRVLLAAEPHEGARWLAAPNARWTGVPEVLCPEWEGSAEHPVEQVHSAHRLQDGRVLLGLRSLETPLVLWEPSSKSPPVRVEGTAWGPARSVSPQGGGERRVWSIVDLGHDDSLAFGAEDGYLRLAQWRNGCFIPLRGQAEFLGSPIRQLATVRIEGGARPCIFLLAGTEGREFFCYEVRSSADLDAQRAKHGDDEPPRTLQLKFRDLLPDAVTSVFACEFPRGELRFCALDLSGALTTFEAPGSEGKLLGRLAGRYQVADGATAALPLGNGRLLVAGWSRSKLEGRLRVLSLECVAPEADSQKEFAAAVAAVAPFTAGLGAEQDPAAERACALDLLACMPLQGPALRRALVERRLESNWDRDRLVELALQAVHAYPDTTAELDELLRAVTESIRRSKEPERFADVYEVFVRPDPRLRPWLRTSSVRQVLVRRLLTAGTLYLWIAGKDAKSLSHWLDRNLLSQDRSVQVVTLRALTEALDGLRRDASLLAKVFPARRIDPSKPDDPPVASAGWVLNTLARFLFAHPSRMYGSECDASTWAAVSVLMNLVRLMPNSAMIIYDHISSNRVDPLVFEVLKRRLKRDGQDASIWSKLQKYVPWTHLDPDISKIREHCARYVDDHPEEALRKDCIELGIQGGDPDEHFMRDFGLAYHWFGKMAAVLAPDDLVSLREGLGELERRFASEEPLREYPWLTRLDAGRKRMFESTLTWMTVTARNALKASPGATLPSLDGLEDVEGEILAERRELAEDAAPASLFAPEINIARSIIAHWRDVLDPAPARPGGIFLGYRVGSSLAESNQSQNVFHVAGGGDLVLAAPPNLAEDRARELARVWKKIRGIAARDHRISHLPEVQHVLHNGRCVGMLYKHVPGRDLKRSAAGVFKLEPLERCDFAHQCAVEMADALTALHGAHLYHGDVATGANIVWSEHPRSFTLLDFDRSGDMDRQNPMPSWARPPYPGLEREFARLRDRIPNGHYVSYMQYMDVVGLLQVVVGLVLGKHAAELEFPTELVQACPDTFQPWAKRLLAYCNGAVGTDLVNGEAARSFREAATEHANGVYFAAATTDAKELREELIEMEAPGWFVQGREPLSGDPLPSQLYNWMLRSRYVIFVLGPSSGSIPPENNDVVRLAKDWAEARIPGWAGTPSYTQIEFFIAEKLAKQIFTFALPEAEPSKDPQQERFAKYVKERGGVERLKGSLDEQAKAMLRRIGAAVVTRS